MEEIKNKIGKVIIVDIDTILKFALNLSFILHPCPLQTAIVVSLIRERLTPKKDPLITLATHNAMGKPDVSATEYAIGVINATVPKDVPIDIDIKQLMINKTIIEN